MGRRIGVWGAVFATVAVIGLGALWPHEATTQQPPPIDQVRDGAPSHPIVAASTAELHCSDPRQTGGPTIAPPLPSGQSNMAPERAVQIASALKTGQLLKSVELSRQSGAQIYVVRFDSGEVDVDATSGEVTADCSVG